MKSSPHLNIKFHRRLVRLQLDFLLGIVLAFAPVSFVQSQTYEWTRTFGGTGYDYCRASAPDNAGNIYVCGDFYETVDFDPGPGTDIRSSAGDSDFIIMKLDAPGNLEWAITMGGVSTENCTAICDRPGDYIFAAGRFSSTMDFDPGPGTDIRTPAVFEDAWAMKMEPDGSIKWTINFGGDQTLSVESIASDSTGNLYITGEFTGIVDFNPDMMIIDTVSSQSYWGDIYLLKLDSSGQFLWVRTHSGGISANVKGLDVDESGNSVVVGGFDGTVDFDPMSPGAFEYTGNGGGDMFIIKRDASGNTIWVKTFGGTKTDIAWGCKTNGPEIWFSGVFSDTLDFDPTPAGEDIRISSGFTDAFITKIDGDGNLLWVSTWGGDGGEYYGALATDMNGNLYITGGFTDTADFDPGPSTYYQYSSGYNDIYVQSLDASGNFRWVKTMGSPKPEIGFSISVNSTFDLWLASSYSDTFDFDPGPTVEIHATNGLSDGFVWKLSDVNIVSVADPVSWKPELFPNPSSGEVYIRCQPMHRIQSIILRDITGQELYYTNPPPIHNHGNLHLTFPVPPGLYLIELQDENGQRTSAKWVKE